MKGLVIVMSMIAYFFSLSPEEVVVFDDPTFNLDNYFSVEISDENTKVISIDKSWHTIHYVLTGEVFGGKGTLAQVIMGGKRIENDSNIYDARIIDAEEVKKKAEELKKIDKSEFIKLFNSRDFSRSTFYAFDYDDLEGEANNAAYYFEILKEHYIKAAKSNEAMLLCIF